MHPMMLSSIFRETVRKLYLIIGYRQRHIGLNIFIPTNRVEVNIDVTVPTCFTIFKLTPSE